MTPQEIAEWDLVQDTSSADGAALCAALKEIAYQLARINERYDKGAMDITGSITVYQP